MTAGSTTSDFFHDYARDFDAIYGNRNTLVNRVVNKYFRSSMRTRFDKTIAGCDPIEGRSVIDIGCGPGHYGIELARRGASNMVGLDFADGMLDIARQHAQHAGVPERCTFKHGDFMQFPEDEQFDYAILMGFMDYMADPAAVVAKVKAITRDRAFFSFPAAGGFLAWQRKLRYKKRCDLYLYTREQIATLFADAGVKADIEPISRDFFVTARLKDGT